jgi:hypothetical protein
MKRNSIEIKLPALELSSEIFVKDYKELLPMQARTLAVLIYIDEVKEKISRMNTLKELFINVMNVHEKSFPLFEDEINKLITTGTIKVENQTWRSVFDIVIGNIVIVEKVKSQFKQNRFYGLDTANSKKEYDWFIPLLSEDTKLFLDRKQNAGTEKNFTTDYLNNKNKSINSNSQLINLIEIIKYKENENKFYDVKILNSKTVLKNQEIEFAIDGKSIRGENLFTVNVFDHANEIISDVDVFSEIKNHLDSQLTYRLDKNKIKFDSVEKTDVTNEEFDKFKNSKLASFLNTDVRLIKVEGKYFILSDEKLDINYNDKKVFETSKYVKHEINIEEFIQTNEQLISFDDVKLSADNRINDVLIDVAIKNMSKDENAIEFVRALSSSSPLSENKFWSILKLFETDHQQKMISVNKSWLNNNNSIRQLHDFSKNFTYEFLYKIFSWNIEDNIFPEWKLQSKALEVKNFINTIGVKEISKGSLKEIESAYNKYFNDDLSVFEINSYSQSKNYLERLIKQLHEVPTVEEFIKLAWDLRTKIEKAVGATKDKTVAERLNDEFKKGEANNKIREMYKFIAKNFAHHQTEEKDSFTKENYLKLSEYTLTIKDNIKLLERVK